MSYYYGYEKIQHSAMHSNLDKKIAALEKKFADLNLNYSTVFDINLKTATKTIKNSRCIEARNGRYCLSQNDTTYAPTFGDDYIENKSTNYMIFCCPELQFGNVSIFVVCEVADTSVSGDWCYLIGNDDGNYDKFFGFKSYSYSELTFGCIRGSDKKTVQLPSSHSILHKHILSGHWMSSGSCMYANAVKIPGSDFKADIKHIGSSFGSVFYDERFNSRATGTNTILKGKIYGFKIVVGVLTPADIVKINISMMKEYGDII